MYPMVPYAVAVVGAASLYLMLRPGVRSLRMIGAIIGAGLFAWLLVNSAALMGAAGADESARPAPLFFIFSLIAAACAVRMITHHRPVYSALYFVMVVLSSAGLFLLLQAEFMAFALVIVYAGAILITYMFVLMLAQQAPSATRPEAAPEYDRVPREPGYAAAVSFIMLALFAHMAVAGVPTLPDPPSREQAAANTWARMALMPRDLEQLVQRVEPGAVLADRAIVVEGGTAFASVRRGGESQVRLLPLPPEFMPGNVQLVGLDLVAKFPVSLELAGVILLMAMFGAVVLARKQIEMGEDEVREAAGLRRMGGGLGLHGDESERAGAQGMES